MLRVPFNLYYAYWYENYSCGISIDQGNVDLEWEDPFSSANNLEDSPLLNSSVESSASRVELESWRHDPLFLEQFLQCLEALDAGIHPQRISQGSSGSYFIRNLDGVGNTMH